MEQFDELVRISEKLLSPEGCPWDHKQTFLTLQPYVLEEAHEVIEAVDLDDQEKMVEELGDLLYTIIFYGKLGEREKRFSLVDIVRGVCEKLVRRHPHVFGEVKVSDVDEIVTNWNKIKQQEKAAKASSNDLPPTMPTLMRGQKIVKRWLKTSQVEKKVMYEQEVGVGLIELLKQAELNGIDADGALRRALGSREVNDL